MHEHSHPHEPGCSCGHEHDDGCACSSCTGGDNQFRLNHAEGATAAAVRFTMPGPRGVAEVTIAQRIKALAADVSRLGGLVGHIKAALTGEAEVTTFSCTGGAVNIGRKTDPGSFTVDLVAILLALDDISIQVLIRKHFPEIN